MKFVFIWVVWIRNIVVSRIIYVQIPILWEKNFGIIISIRIFYLHKDRVALYYKFYFRFQPLIKEWKLAREKENIWHLWTPLTKIQITSTHMVVILLVQAYNMLRQFATFFTLCGSARLKIRMLPNGKEQITIFS